MKLLCFDLDDTLWNFEPVLHRAEQSLHVWLDEHYPEFTRQHGIEDLRELRRQLLSERRELHHDIGRVRLLSMQLAAIHAGYDPAAAKRLATASFKIFMRYRNDVQLYDDVVPVLSRLRERYTLCSLTNGNADLAIIGIDDLFDHSLSAQQVGAAKPAPAIFRTACELAGVSPEQALHIGDDPENDIFAARAAGMKTVWVNRKAQVWSHADKPDAEINSLEELEAYLQIT